MTKEEKIEAIINKAFEKQYYPSDKIWDNWRYEEFITIPRIGTSQISGVKVKIKELLDAGYKVKCGKASTSIRGYYSHFIFYKK